MARVRGSNPPGSAMELKWVLQNNLGRTRDTYNLADTLDMLQVRWEHVPFIPFDESPITGIDSSGITVFYGSHGMVKRVRATGLWSPGVFFEPERFNFQSLLAGFGSNLLNADSEVLSVGELLSRNYNDEELFFSRPTEDSKLFTGGLFYFDELKEFKYRITEPNDPMTTDSLIQLSSPKKIVKELRSFVVDGKVSTSSYYGMNHRNYPEDVHIFVNPEDEAFAQEMANLYQPAKVFTLDTCELEDGTRRVVETNCFNCSGLYHANVPNLVQSINNFLLSVYQ